MEKKVILIFIFALALRLGYVAFVPQIEVGQDAANYCAVARNVAEHHAYLGIDGKPDIFCAPGYPLFVAAVYTVFGVDNFAVRVIQALLSAFVVFFVYHICTKIFDKDIGLIAAIIACIHPGLIGYSGLLLPQLLTAFLILSFVILLMRSRMNVITILAMGIIAGWATLTRPELMLLFFLLLAVFVFWSERKRESLKRVLAILFIAISLISIWSVRNFVIFGKVIPISTHFGDTLWISTWKEEWLEWQLKEPVLTLSKGNDAIEISSRYFKAGLENIKEHPFIYTSMCMKRLYRLWLTGYSNSFNFMRMGNGYYLANGQYLTLFIKLFMLAFNMFIVLAGFLGIWKAFAVFHDKKKQILYVSLPIFFVIVLHFFIFATPRYAIPVMPFVIMFSSITIYRWGKTI